MTDLPGLIFLGLRVSLAVLLYLFLFWSVKTIWRDFQLTRTNASQAPIIPLILIFDRSEEESTHVLMNAENIVGRSIEADIHLPDETVSSHHARIFYEQKRWWIEDLNSSNGIYLNEIFLDQPAVLADKDILRLGNITAQVQIPDNQSISAENL
jgi:hypothetical protein